MSQCNNIKIDNSWLTKFDFLLGLVWQGYIMSVDCVLDRVHSANRLRVRLWVGLGVNISKYISGRIQGEF